MTVFHYDLPVLNQLNQLLKNSYDAAAKELKVLASDHDTLVKEQQVSVADFKALKQKYDLVEKEHKDLMQEHSDLLQEHHVLLSQLKQEHDPRVTFAHPPQEYNDITQTDTEHNDITHLVPLEHIVVVF